jgi:ribonuclease D
VEIVHDGAALNALCEKLAAAGRFGFDTEFVGEDAYSPEVCLIQVATDSSCALIDPLNDGLDLTPFWSLIADEEVQVVVHAGFEDLAIAYSRTQHAPANVFDLQIAAGMIGLGYPTSLTRLARLTVKARLHKSQTLTDWRRRPLSDEQIDYAVEDVAHLLPMYDAIQKSLKKAGRVSWAAEECRDMCRPENFVPTEEQKLRRLRGAGSLRRQELAIANQLVEARDELAAQYNRPARAVVRDHLVVEMARRGWTDVRQLRSLRGLNLSAPAVRKLADAIRAAKKLPEDRWPRLPSDQDNSQEQVLISLATAVLRDYCSHNQLSYALLTNKQDLRTIVRNRTRPGDSDGSVPLATGWRGEAVGSLLNRLLDGLAAVRVVEREGGLGLSVG